MFAIFFLPLSTLLLGKIISDYTEVGAHAELISAEDSFVAGIGRMKTKLRCSFAGCLSSLYSNTPLVCTVPSVGLVFAKDSVTGCRRALDVWSLPLKVSTVRIDVNGVQSESC